MRSLTPLKMLLSCMALGVTAIVIYFSTQQSAPVNTTSITGNEETPRVIEAKSPAQNSVPSATEKKAEFSEMAINYSKTRDMRAFVEYAKQHPELGGWYYAQQGIRDCSTIQDYIVQDKPALNYDTQRSPEMYSKRQPAFETLRTLCQGFQPQEISKDVIDNMYKQGIAKQDIFSTMVGEYQKAGNIKDAAQKLESNLAIKEKIMASKDPLLISDYGSRLNVHSDQKSSSYWLDGKSYVISNDDAPLMTYAWDLVPCSLGMSCEQSNQKVAIACLHFDRCADSLVDLYRQDLERAGDKDGKQFQEVMQLQKRLVEIVQKGEFSAFKAKQ